MNEVATTTGKRRRGGRRGRRSRRSDKECKGREGSGSTRYGRSYIIIGTVSKW